MNSDSKRLAISLLSGLLPLIALSAAPLAMADAAAEDAYIAGYAAAVLHREFKLDGRSLSVRNGEITLPVEGLGDVDRGKVLAALSGIPGVTRVMTAEGASATSSSAPFLDAAVGVSQAPGQSSWPTGLLPPGHLFKPLLADPRWPHFAAAYHYYTGGDFDGTSVGSVGFGETISIYRGSLGSDRRAGQWEAGVQGGVFSDFNLGADSSDLINSDFFVAGFGGLRIGNWSALGRLFHQSSHLGDEFLLRTRLQRVNLSYEGLDLKLSYEFANGARLYGGGGGLVRREPKELKSWSTQYGFEYRSPWRLDAAAMRPIMAVDLKHFEENDWATEVSAKAGVRFDNLSVMGRNFELLVEYFNGYSPSGQFYNEKIEYFGIGAHIHF